MSTRFDSIKVSSSREGESGCAGCAGTSVGTPDIDFAFQPIVDVDDRLVYAYEALVRGPNGEPAHTVLSQVDDENRYPFDQLCRTTAIARASQIGLDAYLSINFMPNAVYRPEACIRSTFEAAQKYNFPVNHIIFETIEGEHIIDRPHLVNIFSQYKKFGFQTAIDDFGAGYSGLTLLVDFQPDLIKLDMALVRGIDTDSVRQHIARGVLAICRDLGIRVIAEGVETRGERDFFSANGVTLMQGYFFAKPAFQAMPQVSRDAFAL
ncbi:Blue light- and temperature-regulated antirepressor BluF (plasmid) [Caballeronia sp. SBC1]|uniref:EAL domain-containing protein n=1 Tax=Caballeronia sp. SBC1 TaxID=2705548 RepID=UPI0014087CDD|nr:EAL domain-containing protein [Caballeronia sp. SBC1]QIN67103.1 Blue light- and temperature-regulated antirepressor BluF [Caballeronia sp. SBC1]